MVFSGKNTDWLDIPGCSQRKLKIKGWQYSWICDWFMIVVERMEIGQSRWNVRRQRQLAATLTPESHASAQALLCATLCRRLAPVWQKMPIPHDTRKIVSQASAQIANIAMPGWYKLPFSTIWLPTRCLMPSTVKRSPWWLNIYVTENGLHSEKRSDLLN